MMRSSELKLRARQALLGNYGVAVGSLFVMAGIQWLLALIMEVVMLMSGAFLAVMNPHGPSVAVIAPILVIFYLCMEIVTIMMAPGMIYLSQNICFGRKAKVSDIFWAFKNRQWRFVGIAFAVMAILIIWMIPVMVLIFASIVTGEWAFMFIFSSVYYIISAILMFYVVLTYGQFVMILVDRPETKIVEALRESRRMMAGNRFRCFRLGLSFVGIVLLAMMSFGIGMLWVAPYMYCTSVFFYMDLKQGQMDSQQGQVDLQQLQWDQVE